MATGLGTNAGDSPATSTGGALMLASIPLGVALLFGALLLPRATIPDDVPLPVVDSRALAKSVQTDHALAEEARRAPLPPEVRAVGSALRAFNTSRAEAVEPELSMHTQKATLDAAVSDALKLHGPRPLLALRAVQLEAFLAEVAHYETTGRVSHEMDALGGGFVPRMQAAGWVRGRRVLLDDAQRRVAFKTMWNATVAVEGVRELQPTADELRALYTLYLTHPHPSETAALALEAARTGAKDAATCAALQAGQRVEAERWRIDKIHKVAAIDPSYPVAFALGIANYRRGSFAAAAENFRDWLRDHPDGAYALRARNYLKAALDADQSGL